MTDQALEKAAYSSADRVVMLNITARHADGLVDLSDDDGVLMVGRCTVAQADPEVGQCVLMGAGVPAELPSDEEVAAVHARIVGGEEFTDVSLAKALKADQLRGLAELLEVEDVPSGTKEEVAAFILASLGEGD